MTGRGPRFAVVLGLVVLAGGGARAQVRRPDTTELSPPVARRGDDVTLLHGESFPDPYRWMRKKGSPEVEAYLGAENAYADAVLAQTRPFAEAIFKELVSRLKETDETAPYAQDGYLLYSKTEEGKQYPILARKKGARGPEEIVLDVNQLAAGKPFMSLGDVVYSDDARLLAYTTDETGYRQYRLRVKDLASGALRPDTAERVTSLAFTGDGKTLYYTVEDPVAKRSYRLYRHTLGRQPVLVLEEKDARFSLAVSRTRSREFLVLELGSLTTTELRVLPAARGAGAWRTVLSRKDGREGSLEHRGDRFYLQVNDTGRNFRLVEAKVRDPDPARWKELVPHRPDVMLTGVDVFADYLVLSERADASTRLAVMLADGSTHTVATPERFCSIRVGNNEEFSAPTFQLVYESLVTPPTTFAYDPRTQQRTVVKQLEVPGYDPSRYESTRLEAQAKDGTRIPISLLHTRGARPDGAHPLWVMGYGAYGYPQEARFVPAKVSLADRGVVIAIAHIRGGSDLGKPWHDGGRMQNKMNSFTDFIAVTEHLVKVGWGDAKRVAASGGSAGGLLMGAVLNLRPDLYRVMASYVPFVDVLNTMLDESLPLTVGEFEEWGNPRVREQLEWMRAYSPYDNIPAAKMPALLVRTSYNDSQVMYWEPAKWVARLRWTATGGGPIVFRTNMAAGHGGASGRYDSMRDLAADYAFVLTQLGVKR